MPPGGFFPFLGLPFVYKTEHHPKIRKLKNEIGG